MNLPLSNLKRDELYTFIVGIFTASAWYLYLQAIGIIERHNDVIDPALVFAWLFSTGLVYIFYTILVWTLHLIFQREINNQDTDKELEKMKLIKNLSFFWAGPLEEEKLLLHIFALLTVSLIFVFHPVISFISIMQINWSWLIAIHVAYTAVTIAAYLMLSKTSYYLHQVNNFVAKGYCDTLDQATYIRERAAYYAKIRNDLFYAQLIHDQQSPAPETKNASA